MGLRKNADIYNRLMSVVEEFVFHSDATTFGHNGPVSTETLLDTLAVWAKARGLEKMREEGKNV